MEEKRDHPPGLSVEVPRNGKRKVVQAQSTMPLNGESDITFVVDGKPISPAEQEKVEILSGGKPSAQRVRGKDLSGRIARWRAQEKARRESIK